MKASVKVSSDQGASEIGRKGPIFLQKRFTNFRKKMAAASASTKVLLWRRRQGNPIFTKRLLLQTCLDGLTMRLGDTDDDGAS